jgi:hypothetical protein
VAGFEVNSGLTGYSEQPPRSAALAESGTADLVSNGRRPLPATSNCPCSTSDVWHGINLYDGPMFPFRLAGTGLFALSGPSGGGQIWYSERYPPMVRTLAKGWAMWRKFQFAVAVAVAATLGALPAQSEAADLPIKMKTMAPTRSSIIGIGSGGTGFVTFAAGTILGVIAGMCAYDIYLKIEGVKNWDGTVKFAQPHKHHHRTA